MRSLYAEHAALAAARQAITQEMQKLIEEGDQIFRIAPAATSFERIKPAQRAGRI